MVDDMDLTPEQYIIEATDSLKDPIIELDKKEEIIADLVEKGGPDEVVILKEVSEHLESTKNPADEGLDVVVKDAVESIESKAIETLHQDNSPHEEIINAIQVLKEVGGEKASEEIERIESKAIETFNTLEANTEQKIDATEILAETHSATGNEKVVDALHAVEENSKDSDVKEAATGALEKIEQNRGEVVYEEQEVEPSHGETARKQHTAPRGRG